MENKELPGEKKKVPQWIRNLKKLIESNSETKKESK